MLETRLQDQVKDSMVKDLEGKFVDRFQDIEGSIVLLSSEISRSNNELFEAIRLLSNQRSHNSSSENSPGLNQHNHRFGYYQNQAGVTILVKLEFPRINGDHIRDWLFKVEKFCELDHTSPDMKVTLAAMHLDGDVATWHQSLLQSSINDEDIKDWERYHKLIRELFEEVYDDPHTELKKLVETNGILDYHTKFKKISMRVFLAEDVLVSNYLAGLKLDTQMSIHMFQPQTVRQCFMLGRYYETAHPRTSNVHGWSNKHAYNTKGLLPTKKEFFRPADKGVHGDAYKEKLVQPQKFLLTEEMNDRRAKRLCYFCPEKFTLEHYKVHRKSQLFLLEIDDEETEDIDNRVPHVETLAIAIISLNAVTGHICYSTMRVKRVHNKRTLFIILDMGSTHNFLDPFAVDKLGCTVESMGNAKVKVADGSKLVVQGHAKNLQWNFQDVSFADDVLVIPLSGCDMVLGVQWLQDLGKTTWDFKSLEMQFIWKRRKVILQGIKPESARAVKAPN